jgi:hypothetical protein
MNVTQGVRRIVLVFVLAVVGAALAQPPTASAKTMVWRVKSTDKHKVQVIFYSKARAFEWPGNGRAYDINNYDAHEYSLTCEDGEKVCLGAWINGNARKYWGVGYKNRHECRNCCYVCDGSEIPRQIID